MKHRVDYTSGLAGSVFRFGAGLVVRRGQLGPRPEQLLSLYEFESCPHCRKVREALTELDLEVKVHPCPKKGERFRPTVIERGHIRMFPWFSDPNRGVEMYESVDIVRYLYEHYGRGRPPLSLSLRPIDTGLSTLASAVRPTRGTFRRPSRAPDEPLHLWSFEASPYCRLAREALCELEIPYVLHNVGKRSPSRKAFVARSGKMQVPWLSDPNTGVEMFESADIVRYLNETYGA